MKYSLRILRNKKLRKRHNFYQIFLDPQLQPFVGFWASLNIQEKEAQEDYTIQEIALERTYS